MAKKKIQEVEAQVPDPDKLNPSSSSEFIGRAWLYYSRGQFQLSINDYLTAQESEPGNVDALYGLALSYKAVGNSSKSLEYFEKALSLIDSLQADQRSHILVRLIHGQINQIKTGDWNLEKEVWHSDT